MKYSLFFIAILLILGGCSQPTLDMDTMPKIQVPKKQLIQQRKKGALYSQKGSSLFSDKKDLQIGDILQVIVQETLKNDSTGSRAIKKNTTSSLGGGLMTPMDGVTLGGTTQKLTDKVNKTFGVGFGSTTANSFAGSANSKVDEKFTTTISVIIEQTYQNGNYFVKGSKEMLIDGQKQFMAISGTIRPYDITPENTVYSHQLANLRIKYFKDGEENDANHKSWGTKIIEGIWPF
jgi:flagellar L-ring protein precursor FlgH